MTYFFRLTLQLPDARPCLYRAEIDGTHEVFLILDEEQAVIRPVDRDGVPVGSLRMTLPDGGLSGTAPNRLLAREFPLIAAHLLAQWRKEGRPPAEIRRYFA